MLSCYRYSDKEMSALLKSLTIVVDTREQQNQHILSYFTEKKIPYATEKIDFADYTAFLPANPELGIVRDTYIDCFVERKGSIEELSGNLTNDRTRLEDEFLRSKGNRIILMLEESAGLEKIIQHKYDTQYNEKSFLASLFSFGHRYGIGINFIDKHYSGLFIYYQLYYAARELLKG